MELKELRESTGLSQRQVAKLTDVSISTIRNLEQKDLGSDEAKTAVTTALERYKRFSKKFGNYHEENIDFLLAANQLDLTEAEITDYTDYISMTLLSVPETSGAYLAIVDQVLTARNLITGLQIWEQERHDLKHRFLVIVRLEDRQQVTIFKNEQQAVAFSKKRFKETDAPTKVVYVERTEDYYASRVLEEKPFRWERWERGVIVVEHTG